MNKQEESSQKKGSEKMMQIIVFKLGEEDYALQIEQVKEVVRTPAITRMPQSPKYVRGVANIRGNIIAIVDLEERFGLVTRSLAEINEKGNYTLVIESEDYKMGVLVQEVPNTLAISESSIDQTVTGGDDQGYIRGIVKLDKRLIVLIDVFRIIEQKETASLKTAAATV